MLLKRANIFKINRSIFNLKYTNRTFYF